MVEFNKLTTRPLIMSPTLKTALPPLRSHLSRPHPPPLLPPLLLILADVIAENPEDDFLSFTNSILIDSILPNNISTNPTKTSPIFGNIGEFFRSILTVLVLKS